MCRPLNVPELALGLAVGFFVVLAACPAVSDGAEGKRSYDLVLHGGRVIDPETGLDGVRDVGIVGDRVAAISERPLQGEIEIDAASLVVAPGFIDLHSHSPTPLGQRYQVMDGVTTALELEAGAFPIDEFGRLVRERPLINYGASAGYGSIRLDVKLGIRRPHLLTDPSKPTGLGGYWTAIRSLFTTPTEVFEEVATDEERRRLRAKLEEGVDQGAIGIGLPLDYMSEGVDGAEARMVFEVAGGRQVPLFIHLRRGVNGDPSGLREALFLARETRAPLHVCHIQHNAMRNTGLFLEEIAVARAEGVDVTTELLPYNAGSALISSAVFSRDWRTVFDIDYEDVEWAATGERFDEAMWNEYREKHPEGQVIHHYVQEAWTRRALREPGVIVVSDLLPMIDEESKVAPHNGAFAKVLGRYVREDPLLDLETAIAKMTLLPARRLEAAAPVFRGKGRLQVGADADLTVFDPATVIDRATYADPYQPSAGIVHVIVNGVLVVRDGALLPDVYPGRALSGPISVMAVNPARWVRDTGPQSASASAP
jgi:N-acyl-D-aspartate/D-glutamate deacylase